MKNKSLIALTIAFVVACSAASARGFGRIGGFRPSGGFGGSSFGRRSGGFGGFFGTRPSYRPPSRPTAPSRVIAPPPMRPGIGFGTTRTDRNIGGSVPSARPQAGRTLGAGTSSPTNLGTPPSARPRSGTGTASGGTGTFGGARYPRYGSDRPVTYQRGYGGVYVPVGYNPVPFYAWYFLPWLMPHPYPSGFGYAYHANPLVSLVATFLVLSVLFIVIWLLYRAAKLAFRGRSVRRYE